MPPLLATLAVLAAGSLGYDVFVLRDLTERSLLLYQTPESAATPLMEAIESRFPGVKVFSLPSVGDDRRARHIELGVKGPVALVEAAWPELESGARALGPVEDLPASR